MEKRADARLNHRGGAIQSASLQVCHGGGRWKKRKREKRPAAAGDRQQWQQDTPTHGLQGCAYKKNTALGHAHSPLWGPCGCCCCSAGQQGREMQAEKEREGGGGGGGGWGGVPACDLAVYVYAYSFGFDPRICVCMNVCMYVCALWSSCRCCFKPHQSGRKAAARSEREREGGQCAVVQTTAAGAAVAQYLSG